MLPYITFADNILTVVHSQIISAQQLPSPKSSKGRDLLNNTVDPYVEVSLHVPDWTRTPFLPTAAAISSVSSTSTTSTTSTVNDSATYSPANTSTSTSNLEKSPSSARTLSVKTSSVKRNGFNPLWEEKLELPYDCVADMKDLIFVRFVVKDEKIGEDEPLAVYCISLGSLQEGMHLLLTQISLSASNFPL